MPHTRPWTPGTLVMPYSVTKPFAALDEPAPEEALYDWRLMCTLLEAQQPSWEPGTAQGESVSPLLRTPARR